MLETTEKLVIELYLAGHTTREVARMSGVPRSTVQRWLTRLNVPTRTRSQATTVKRNPRTPNLEQRIADLERRLAILEQAP